MYLSAPLPVQSALRALALPLLSAAPGVCIAINFIPQMQLQAPGCYRAGHTGGLKSGPWSVVAALGLSLGVRAPAVRRSPDHRRTGPSAKAAPPAPALSPRAPWEPRHGRSPRPGPLETVLRLLGNTRRRGQRWARGDVAASLRASVGKHFASCSMPAATGPERGQPCE